MTKQLFSWALALLWLSVWLPSATGAEPAATSSEQILSSELKQQQIRITTQRVADQLASIIAEFERNGIAGEDVKVLGAIRSVLGNLSEKDMDKVIGLLQEAREATDETASKKRVLDAFSGQKTIITQLRQLLLEYQRQQALYEISLRLKELANRQSGNMRLGVWLSKMTEGKASNAFDEGQKLNLQLQQAEQESLKDEVGLVVEKLGKIAKEILDGPTRERPKAALQQAKDGGLMPALDAAVEELKAAKVLSATGNEKKARDQLREMARLLTLSQNPTDALRQALRELDQAIDQQKKVRSETEKLEKKDDSILAETKQAELVDQTDLIRRDVDSIAPVVAEHLRTSTDRMQEARSVLSSAQDTKQKRTQAPPKQSDALNSLEQARRELLEQLAKAEEESIRPENALAALKELRDQVRELIEQEEKLKAETAAAEKKDLVSKAPKQGELSDQAQALQAKAAKDSPPAASLIGEAANQMQKAQNSLAAQENNPAAQQAAIDALQKAEQQLAQEIARLEQAQQELAELEELLKKLIAVIEEQQKVQMSTVQEAVKKEIQPLTELAGQQEKLGTETGQLQQEASTPVPAAAGHLGEAKGHMGEARNELDKPAPKSAQPKQTEALADLHAAKKEIENKIEELQEMLGMSEEDNAQALADAAEIIEQARRDVNQAMNEMQESPGLMEALTQKQKEIADSLERMSQSQPDSKPVSQAQQAANQAAQQLAQSNLPAAVGSMKGAQNAMQQAMKSQGPTPGKGSPSLPQLSEDQTEVQKAAEALMAALESAPAGAMEQAAKLLQKAGQDIGPLTAGKMGRLPTSAQSALQSAEGDLAKGAAEACAGQGVPAQCNASSAAQALAQAQAALALAQAGLSSESAMASPGQGKGKGKGQGQGRGQGQGIPGPQGTGKAGNWAGPSGTEGPRRSSEGSGTFTGLPKRDRAAIQQSQSEKYPQEYGPLVEQYLKNLSDQSGEK